MWLRRIILILLFLVVTYCSVRPAHGRTYVPRGDVIGSLSHYTVRKGDTLYSIARRYDIGIVELLAANPGTDPWTPEEGLTLTLPTIHILPEPREGIVLNLSELRLFYFAGDETVMSFPVGIGRDGWVTPLGVTSVVKKRRNPVWIPPASIREEDPALPEMVPAGPDNPMGLYALNLGWVNYAIHGTNRPYGIGKRSSHGCIRLYPEDIEVLFNAVAVGTPVTVIDVPFKLGWRDETLLLEVTPTQDQSDRIAEYKKPHPASIPEIYDAIREVTAESMDIDWYAVDKAVADHNGIPVIIGKKNTAMK